MDITVSGTLNVYADDTTIKMSISREYISILKS